MRSISRNGIDLKKLSLMAILVNAVQIVSSVFIAAILLATPQLISDIMVQVLLIAVLIVTITGAVYDITEAVRARKLDSSHDMLEDSYNNLTYLNTEMRKQRHDFKNHLQVIYSLLELNEPNEAIAYIDRVNADLSHVQSSLKTIHPAVNALIAAKKNDADEAGIMFTLNVQTDLEKLPVPSYEICRALSNLIDNAFDALIGQVDPMLRLSIEDLGANYRFTVSNNGPAIDQAALDHIFTAGYSTKGTGRGMGLAIVSDIAKSAGGGLFVDSLPSITKFIIEIPKK